MGIDNDAKLIFGWVIDYDDVVNYVKSEYSDKIDIDDIDEINSVICDNNAIQIDDYVHIGRADPFYDCRLSQSTYFLALYEGTELSISNIIKYIDLYTNYTNNENNNYNKIVEKFKLGNYQPRFISFPHIW